MRAVGRPLCEGETIVREPITTRDHTEIALRELGADIAMEPRVARVRGGAKLTAKCWWFRAIFRPPRSFIVAALITRDSDVIITNVGLNPTRTALLDVLQATWARIFDCSILSKSTAN